MYLDYAENQAARQKYMTMKDWIEKLDAFLKFNEVNHPSAATFSAGTGIPNFSATNLSISGRTSSVSFTS